MSKENLKLWDAVSKTDPAHTKRVNQRGGFTAIGAHYQILTATEQFGPIGIGWGYDASEPIMLGDVVTVGVTIWHGTRENRFGPVWGGADLRDSKGKLDSDAVKKAGTDGLTKGLSQLGFNADVFLGRFDDNKYVEAVRQEFAANDQPKDEPEPREKLDGKHTSKTALKKALEGFVTKLRAATSTREIDALVKEYAADLEQGARYLPKWMEGDPSKDWEGITVLTNHRRDLVWLTEGLRANDTVKDRDHWYGANEAAIEALDDKVRREFDAAFEEHEAGLKMVDRATAGA